MARHTGAVCKLCRREGVQLFLKGERCFTDKCGINRRAYAPGEAASRRGRRPRKMSDFGKQLREKQKLRRIYGVFERQFRHYYNRANSMEGKTGDRLLQLLERRLDTVVLRMGFAPSLPAARQLVRHGHIQVNGRKVNIPSFRCKPGNVITVKEKSSQLPLILDGIRLAENRPQPSYLDVDRKKLTGTVLQLPERGDIQVPVEEQLVVELYSK
jgi:small subunit ribosomal protein S4